MLIFQTKVSFNNETNCRKCGLATRLHLLAFQHGDGQHVEFVFGSNITDYRNIWTTCKLSGYPKTATVPSVLISRVLFGRCIVGEPQRKTTTTNRWRRTWVTVINTPTSWCSAMPANCFETTKGLFTTNMENILSHGWGTRASWLIGRLNKLRPKHYANHLSCPLACFKIQGTTWSLSCRSLEILATDDECFKCFLAC